MPSLLGGGSSSKDPSAANKSAIANVTTRLSAAGKEPSLLGQSYADTGNQSFKDQLLSKLSPLMDATDSALNVAERPGQAILHGLQAFSGTHGHITPDVLSEAAHGFAKGLTDVRGTDNLNLRATLNEDPNKGGRLAGLFDTIGTSAIDPLSYVTAGGGGSIGKAGLKVIESKLGKDTAEQVAKFGAKSLPTETLQNAREALTAAKDSKFADKVLGTTHLPGALEDGAGLRFAGKTVIPAETLRPLAEAAHIPQAAERIGNTEAAKLVKQAVVPLAKLKGVAGEKATQAVRDILTRGHAAADNAATDVLTQTRAAAKQSGHSLTSVQDNLTTALKPVQSNSLAARMAPIQAARSQLDEGGKQLLDKVVGLRQEATEAAQKAGVAIENPTNRVFTPQALKAINRNTTTIARSLQMDAHASPSAIARHLINHELPHLSPQEANARLAETLGIKKVFKDNPIEAATDITVKAHRDAAVADTLRELSTVKTEHGEPLLLIDDGTNPAIQEAAKRFGYTEAHTVLGRVFAPKELIPELQHAAVSLTDDEALKQFGSIFEKWSKLWRGYATVPVLFGAGFHERNLVGNLFNMWLGGFRLTDAPLLNRADKIGRAIESGTNNGLAADAAIDEAKSLSPEDRRMIRLARENGVVGDSFFRTDLATNTLKAGDNKSVLKKAADQVNPVNNDNAVLRTGKYIGRRIEDNSRLAMFMSEMAKHGDPQVAADQVKKYLFDYSELTPTEQKIKKVIPFYTYTRKNTPLQIQALLQNPGKFADLAHLRDNAQAGASDSDGKAIPQYALQNGAIPLVGGDNPIVGSFSTPFQAAMQQIQPLLELASQTPGTPQNIKSEGGAGKALREILGNFGGGPLDLAKAATEEATGTSLLTGTPLKKGTGGKRLANSLIPLYGKGDSTISNLADPEKRNAQLLASLAGLQTTALTDKATGGETARRANVLSGLAKGTPTMAELRKQGKAPKAHKAKTATHKAKKIKVSPLAKKKQATKKPPL